MVGDSSPDGLDNILPFLLTFVVLRHGGALEVDSDVGRGAEFRLVLPQRLDAPPDDDEQ